MTDLSEMPDQELIEDLAASESEVLQCRYLLAHGVTELKTMTVQERLDGNLGIIDVIKREQRRRADVAQ